MNFDEFSDGLATELEKLSSENYDGREMVQWIAGEHKLRSRTLGGILAVRLKYPEDEPFRNEG